MSMKYLCSNCVDEAFLKAEIEREGKIKTCSYCDLKRSTYSLPNIAERIEEVVAEHFERTPLAGEYWPYSDDREGEPVVGVIADLAGIEEDVAEDIQAILEGKHAVYDKDHWGEECEFHSESHYKESDVNDREWRLQWGNFRRSLQEEARFFNREAADHLEALFKGLDTLKTWRNLPIITTAGPGTKLRALYRARVFQSQAPLVEALKWPEQHLGPPPASIAGAGRMNPRGISVFYGATAAPIAIAEVRPPVGSQVLVGKFFITRPLRLLDLTALRYASESGSLFDPEFSRKLEKAKFLRSLSEHMTRPVMPDDEATDYLPTQAIADFLSTGSELKLDGILFPSVQAESKGKNVVLFHKAALVKDRQLPDGTEVEVNISPETSDGHEPGFTVWEMIPKSSTEVDLEFPFQRRGMMELDRETRQASLELDIDSLRVHSVKRVMFRTESFSVSRYQTDKDFDAHM